ncbi:hypothetical protein FF011L_17970 [Roseimaritima multifibrata]|uniref:DUF4340 domain-containing protein n=1 Tax=Roseimaritima multifibrata TaxID=1930274 RepID=A0A517MDT3_9BACT|nr:DUF4340 domain-containing protein [Roseimaritima multifibrata]QDS93042.1 hypothetical protein FF011L_17970 [Roseimaritima multifibrata]
MNEEAKTGIFWAVAIVVAAVATFVAWPTTIESEESAQVGKPLFEKFTDPLAAASLKIVTFDADQSSLSDFEVAKGADGVWRIPTHGSYAADAEQQMQKAATVFLDKKILDVSTTNREEHAGFGVIDPSSSDVEVGTVGVGRLVTMKDDKGTTLVSLIVGNEVENQPGQRYVRRPGQDIVYAVELNDEALATKFTDWIDADLLQLAAFDVAEVTLDNYSAALDMLQGSVRMNRDFLAELSVDGSDWKLDRLDVFKGGTSVPRPLKENEQLNVTKLNELKQALDELKIADVGRKPEGVSANLKASKIAADDQETVASLLARGFIPLLQQDGKETEVIAANGEMTVSMKDGVRYILRFGNVAGLSENEQDPAQPAEAAGNEPGMMGSNRYLLVTTDVDESMIPVPPLQSIPQTIEELDGPAEEPKKDDPAEAGDMKEEPKAPAEEKPAEEPEMKDEKPADEKPADEKPADEKPADEKPADEKSADEKSADEKSTDEKPADEKPADEKPADEKPAESGETTQEGSGDGSATGQGMQADDKAADEPVADSAKEEEADAPAADADKKAADAPEKVEETAQEKQERLEAAQEQITKLNQRLMDERNEKLEAARKRSTELNARFADWYYEISESTFSKLQLGLDVLIEPKTDPNGAPANDPAANLPQFQFPGVN